jgi:hypothetical protein
MKEKDYSHLFIKDIHTKSPYSSIPRPIPPTFDPIPQKDKTIHGDFIKNGISAIWDTYDKDVKEREGQGLPIRDGEYISFSSGENSSLYLDSFNSRTSGGKLLNLKYNAEDKVQTATVFIPNHDKDKLIKAVEKYQTGKTKTDQPPGKAFINRIDKLHKSTVKDLWVGDLEYMPQRDVESWVELWLANEENIIDDKINDLFTILELIDIQYDENILKFPERTIVSIKVNFDQLEEVINSFSPIAEIRKSEELNSFWLDLNSTDSKNWVDDLLDRVNFQNENNIYITIIDSGINNAHFLIAPVLSDQDRLTCNTGWGINDSGANGHGTKMAGLSIYGDLKSLLDSFKIKEINHQLESVKIIPPNGWSDDSRLPFNTDLAIKTATINKPNVRRIYCFAITSQVDFDFGKPSSWSAVLDDNIFGDDNNDKKIFIISAGNVRDEEDHKNYFESNLNSQIFNPAQAWNAITVGAYTQKVLPDKPTVANSNELSPFSRTSVAWDSNWPIKPEVVFEGGNLVKQNNGDVDFDDDLELLTTKSMSIVNDFTTIAATSAATALASNFMAQLRNIYPDSWEETLRGLMVHSASWTEEMKSQLNYDGKKSSIVNMLRTYGYGVPNLIKARESKDNYLTFISEEEIQPYFKDQSGSIRTKDVHFYRFPWPKDTLLSMGAMEVKIKVTLSYFIEPNPGDKGYSTKYSYQSTALRFSLIPPNDDPDNFMLTINNEPRNQIKEHLGIDKRKSLPDGYFTKKDNIKWELGMDNVFKGSVHSNYCTLTAADASNCEYLAVYPLASGWWKNLKKMKRYNSKMRYSLIVSLEVPENTNDIYTEISTLVKTKNLVKV